ncbi:MAG: polysaccharide deacetylase family protein [Henriciella sp.]|nr:polysaccharide deacetylase family protein [Henriciella sp.]
MPQSPKLPDDYLKYPNRQYGMDNPHYGWDPADRRAPFKLKGDTKATTTIIVPVEFFPLSPPAKPFAHPGAMKTPYPDLRHFTTRDYGNRVGLYRLLRAFAAEGVKATFAVNAEVARRYPPLLATIEAGGHEIAAHGVSTAHIHHDGLSEAEESALIAETRTAFPEAKTWMSPARNESYRTLDLLSEAGFETVLDWEADQRPLSMRTKMGSITALPHYGELGDFKLLLDRSHSEDEWADQIIEAAAYSVDLYDKEGASALAFTMTPYIAGQPFRIHAVRRILKALTATEGLSLATATDASAAFKEAIS